MPRMPAWAWWLLLLWNALTAALYGFDKLMAKMDRWRVREATLLWATFLCGCVGAWFAMSLFRHKTQKGSFRWRAIVLTLCNPLWFVLWWAWHAR